MDEIKTLVKGKQISGYLEMVKIFDQIRPQKGTKEFALFAVLFIFLHFLFFVGIKLYTVRRQTILFSVFFSNRQKPKIVFQCLRIPGKEQEFFFDRFVPLFKNRRIFREFDCLI